LSRPPLRLAVAATRAQRTLDFAARLDALAAQARAGGAAMLLLPEYFSTEAVCGEAPDLEGELRRAVAVAASQVAVARAVAARHGLWLLPGSLLCGGEVTSGPDPGPSHLTRNLAPLIAPDGTTHWTAKHRLTRFESEEWGIAAGPPPAPFETPWGPIAVAICYDAEFPPITRGLASQGAFVILVPAATDTPAGATRVEISARAAAIQNQCFVAVAATVGETPWSATLDTGFGRAAIFGPADRGFPHDGVLAAGPWHEPAMAFADLDTAALQAVRRDGAVRNFSDWPEA
jgi:predicted amidohydrolase